MRIIAVDSVRGVELGLVPNVNEPPPHPAQVAYFYDSEVGNYYYGQGHPMKVVPVAPVPRDRFLATDCPLSLSPIL